MTEATTTHPEFCASCGNYFPAGQLCDACKHSLDADAQPESVYTPANDWQRHPEHWHSVDMWATEREVTALVAAFVLALQPEIVVETGTYVGQTAEAIGRILQINGHGHCYSIEIDPALAATAARRVDGLPVSVLCRSSLEFDPPGPVGFAWLDSSIHDRRPELDRLRPHLQPGAVVGFHDTAPHHALAAQLAPLIAAGELSAITLRTPRGVTFAQVNG